MVKAEKLFQRFSSETIGQRVLPAGRLHTLVESLGHSIKLNKLMQYVESSSLTWFAVQSILDKIRKLEMDEQVERCGFSQSEVDNIKTVFKIFDPNNMESINVTSFVLLLTRVGMMPKSSNLRERLEGLDAQDVSQGRMSMAEVFRNMRRLQDEGELMSITKEADYADACGFDTHELTRFKKTFLTRAEADVVGMNGALLTLKDLRVDLIEADVQHYFLLADRDKSNDLDFAEFTLFLRELVDADVMSIRARRSGVPMRD